MSNKRCYKQYCGVAKAMDVIGERWTLLIVRDLMLGPWRYSDLLERLPGMTTNLLASRLKEMEGSGLIKKTQLSSLGSPHVYELTALGRELEPAMLALNQFGFNYMHGGPKSDEQVDPGRALLNLKSRYRSRKKGFMTLCFNNEYAENRREFYQIDFSPAGVDIRFGKNTPVDACVELSMGTYADLAFRNANAKELEKQGKLSVIGEQKIWIRFLESFGLNAS